jgi:hypothetical protein
VRRTPENVIFAERQRLYFENLLLKEGTINQSPQLPIRVYLAVQNRLLRETLVRLFQKQPGIAAVGKSQSQCHGTSEHSVAPPCDMLLLDSFSTVNTRNLIEGLNELTSQTRVVLRYG